MSQGKPSSPSALAVNLQRVLGTYQPEKQPSVDLTVRRTRSDRAWLSFPLALTQALPSCSYTSRSCGCRSEGRWGRALATFSLLLQQGLLSP